MNGSLDYELPFIESGKQNGMNDGHNPGTGII